MYNSPSLYYSPILTQGLASLSQSYPQGYKEGGLAKMAQKVEAAGRNGDTMLAHITPQEALMLRMMGGSGTINPQTGLPEFFLKKLVSAVAQVIKPLAPLIPFLNFIPGIGPLSSLATKALLTGIASGANKDGSFDFKRGLTSGALSYGIGSLMAPAGGAGGTGGTGGVESGTSALSADQVGALSGDAASAAAGDAASAAASPGLESALGDTGAAVYDGIPSDAMLGGVNDFGAASATSQGVSSGLPMDRAPIEMASSSAPSSFAGMTDAQMAAARAAENANLPSSLLENVTEAGKAAVGAIKDVPLKDALQTTGTALTSYGAYESYKERERLKEEEDKRKEDERRKKAEDEAFARDVMSTYQPEFRRPTAEDVKSLQLAKGGIANLKKKPARFLKGKGDGMSDSIRANIDGKQKARLSDGEFVIPADVVSHLGNGSSQAGAKKLYDMMSRLRQARTGNGKQAPAVKAERYMPA